MGTLRLELYEEQSKRRQSIVLHGNCAPKRTIAYEFDFELPCPAVWDGYVCAVIFHAMRRADKLIVEGPLSQHFLRNIRAFQEAWRCLRPSLYKVVDVEPTAASPAAPPPVPPPGNTVAAFSGGIDSSFSLLRHTSHALRNGTHIITAAVMVHGFDVPYKDLHAFQSLRDRVVGIADAAGVELKTVRTTIRERETENWEDYHAGALASVLHLFSRLFSYGMIASSDSYNYLSHLPYVWGSSAATDYLLSGAGMEIVHDGAGYTRPQKLAWLARAWPQLVPLTQFCWEGKSRDVNCGLCNKCVRTRLSLLAAGHDDRLCFGSKFNLSMLDRLAWDAKNLPDLKSIADFADEMGCAGEWLRVVKNRVKELTFSLYVD